MKCSCHLKEEIHDVSFHKDTLKTTINFIMAKKKKLSKEKVSRIKINDYTYAWYYPNLEAVEVEDFSRGDTILFSREDIRKFLKFLQWCEMESMLNLSRG